MKAIIRGFVMLLLLGASPGAALAAPSTLIAGAMNIDGAIYLPGEGPIDWAGFDTTTGMGTVNVGVTGAGAHHVLFYVDLTLGVVSPGDELGDYCCGWPAGLSWEIGDPAVEISAHFAGNVLDNSIEGYFPLRDIAMALGWNLTLAGPQQASIRFDVSNDEWSVPMDWYMLQADCPGCLPPEIFDPQYPFTYLTTKLDLSEVPEPAALSLLAACAMALTRRRRPLRNE